MNVLWQPALLNGQQKHHGYIFACIAGFFQEGNLRSTSSVEVQMQI